MLLFGNEGKAPKPKGPKAQPNTRMGGTGGARGLGFEADPNRAPRKQPSPSLYVPTFDQEAIKLPRLPTPDNREQQKDTLRPSQGPTQPMTAREERSRGFDEPSEEFDRENRHDNRGRDVDSRDRESPVFVEESATRRSRLMDEENKRADDEGRIIEVNSRLDGKAWEDGPTEDKDPVAHSFRELKMQCQVLKKKEGSKEFPAELKAMEQRLKMLEGQVMRDRLTIIRKHKEQKRDTNSLKQNLNNAREQMQATMAQAADDVIILTQKLQDIESKYAQCRVDKDHLERSFKSEMEVLKKQNVDIEERLMGSRLEVQEMARQVQHAENEVRQLTKEKGEAVNANKILQDQVDSQANEVSSLRSVRTQLERQVQSLEGEIQLEKSNVKNEVSRVQMERERHNERVTSLQQQLERAIADAATLEDYKAEAADSKRKLQQAERLLDEAEEVRKEALKSQAVSIENDKNEIIERLQNEVEVLKRQFKNAQDEKEAAAHRLQHSVQELQSELSSANNRISELTRAKGDAQDALSRETESLLQQLQRAQAESTKQAKTVNDLQERMLNDAEKAQTNLMSVKEELMTWKLKAQEAVMKAETLEGQTTRLQSERDELSASLKEAEKTVKQLNSSTALEDLKRELAIKEAQVKEAKAMASDERARADNSQKEGERLKVRIAQAEHMRDGAETAAAQAQGEREVFAGMVKQLMAQLTRARLDNLAALQGKQVPLQDQLSQVAKLLESAKAQKSSLDSAAKTLEPHERRVAIDRFVEEVRSSRASSVAGDFTEPQTPGMMTPFGDRSYAPQSTRGPSRGPSPATSFAASNLGENRLDTAAPPATAGSRPDTVAASDISEAAAPQKNEIQQHMSSQPSETLILPNDDAEAETAANEANPDEATEVAETQAGNIPVIEQDPELEQAAIKIQARARGMRDREKVRNQLEQSLDDGETLGADVSGIPAQEPSVSADAAEPEPSQEEVGTLPATSGENDPELEQAAIKIQARARGMRDRGKVKEYLEEQMAGYDEESFENEEAAAPAETEASDPQPPAPGAEPADVADHRSDISSDSDEEDNPEISNTADLDTSVTVEAKPTTDSEAISAEPAEQLITDSEGFKQPRPPDMPSSGSFKRNSQSGSRPGSRPSSRPSSRTAMAADSVQ